MSLPCRCSARCTGTRPCPPSSRAALETMLARTMPVVLLLADGVPRSKRAIVTALADGHSRKEVGHAVMRLAVTGGIVERQGRFTLASNEDDGAPAAG